MLDLGGDQKLLFLNSHVAPERMGLVPTGSEWGLQKALYPEAAKLLG